jgi:hypothetical protein
MAETGDETDRCLKEGFLPITVHYYSPIPDISELEPREIWNRKSELVGIDFHVEKQVEMLLELGRKYGDECDWPSQPSAQSANFYTENGSFSFGCAAALHSIVRNYKPKRVIEVGSGNSSLVLSSALARNKADGVDVEYTIIDPYSPWRSKQDLPELTRVISEKVELTEVDRFLTLQENDILFIDSGHTVRTGGDVNFLFLDVIPRLAPGAIIHVHDIGLPYEYPKTYFTNPAFRVFWTEAYILQAFLSCNPQFDVMLAMHYLMANHRDKFREAFAHNNPALHLATSGSFWMRRLSK